MLFVHDMRHVQIFAGGLVTFTLCFFWFTASSLSAFQNHRTSTSAVTTGYEDSRPKVELERIKMGESFEVTYVDSTPEQILEKLSQDLLDRFARLNVDTAHPNCNINISRYASSGILSNNTPRYESSRRIGIALNLYNSQEILPSLSLALLGLVLHLQPTHQIYISVFENDSTDKTPELLGEFAAALVAAKVSGLTFRHSILERPRGAERINALANIRNEAVLPLLPYAADGILLFVNDVVTCTSDLLELVHQLRLQKAHGVMGTDWDDVAGQPRFRDIWVARGINGQLPYKMNAPAGFSEIAPSGNWVTDFWLTQDESIHRRWLDGRPTPVYSGWNGAIALDAKLFTHYHMRFRASGKTHWSGGDASGAMGQWGQLIATEGYLESDCTSSECKLFARDAWNLIGNATRFVLAPQSRTTYNLPAWDVVEGSCPPTRRTGGDEWIKEIIDWTNITIPNEVVCVPSLTADESVIDPWDETNKRLYFNPRIDGWPREP